MRITIEVNDINFETEVLNSDRPVLVDFWAEWCGPCKMIAPVLEEIAREQGDRVKIVKVNVDDSPALAARYDVRAIPTLLYFAGGQLRQRTLGAMSKKAIISKLEELVVAA